MNSLPRGGLLAHHGLLQTIDRRLHRHRGRRLEDPAAAGHRLAAGLGLALPDASGPAPDAGLPAEVADVLLALLDLVPLRDLSQGGAVARAVLASDADLFRVLGHWVGVARRGCGRKDE